jgi:hypothetical protein
MGWDRDQTPAVSQCQPMSPGHPPSTAYSDPAGMFIRDGSSAIASATSPADAFSASSKPNHSWDCLEIAPVPNPSAIVRSVWLETVLTREKDPVTACPPKAGAHTRILCADH